MALLHKGSKCPICDHVLGTARNIYATSGVAFPPEDPLWRFCDAGIHADCFERWPERERFSRGYFASAVSAAAANPNWGVVWNDDSVLLTVNPGPQIAAADVHLAATVASARVPLASWERWLAGELDDAMRPSVLEELRRIRPRLRAAAPTVPVMLARAIYAPNRTVPSVQFAPSENADELARFDAEAGERAAAIREHGRACPHCASDRRDHIFTPRKRGGSFFVCGACHRSFTHRDLMR